MWGGLVLPMCIKRKEFLLKTFKIHQMETITFINVEFKLWSPAEHELKTAIISVRVHLTCSWRRPTSLTLCENTAVLRGQADSSYAGIGPSGIPVVAAACLLPCPKLLPTSAFLFCSHLLQIQKIRCNDEDCQERWKISEEVEGNTTYILGVISSPCLI